MKVTLYYVAQEPIPEINRGAVLFRARDSGLDRKPLSPEKTTRVLHEARIKATWMSSGDNDRVSYSIDARTRPGDRWEDTGIIWQRESEAGFAVLAKRLAAKRGWKERDNIIVLI
jgi:hypothetical protein